MGRWVSVGFLVCGAAMFFIIVRYAIYTRISKPTS
jgi:hypothetical protein